ncbi:spore gernimation protein GerA [Paenibacillus sp. T1]|uniref:Spore gernimation protein GerA n=2 Tax=Paenibacillus glycinis TaxID=2697035 RepID=A0ABW9XX41_9BACL|nr:spore gernimation protein GerA [Paenibacillus glycinis]
MKNKFSGDDDFFALEETFMDSRVVLAGFNTLLDIATTKLGLQAYIEAAVLTGTARDELKAELGEVCDRSDSAKARLSLLTGKLLICFEDDGSCVIMEPTPKPLNRAIEPPINENVFQGSLNSFTEDIHANIGIVRKQLLTDNLRVGSYHIGTEETTKISLLYYEGRTNMEFIHKLVGQIQKNRSRQIENLQQLSKKIMGFPSWVLISKFSQTELPQEAANFLRKGRAVLFIDRLPIALVVPSLLWDVFFLDSDRNLPLPLMLFLRALRLIGAWLTVVLPGLYVALVSVNPEVLRIEMAISIAQTRVGIPYPAIIEMILMLFILELIIEASIRLPKNIGPTITMVGGIILGQAVVQAKLVSNLLIIILAATTISNSTIVGLQHSLSLRISKYVIVIMAAIYGVLGILEGLLLICAYVASLNTYGIPYIGFSSKKDEIKHG